MQTVALYLCYIQYVCNERFFFNWSEKSALPTTFLNLYTNLKSEMRSFKSNENIHKKEGGSYYVVSANKASSVTL